jgi:hypothetical protein
MGEHPSLITRKILLALSAFLLISSLLAACMERSADLGQQEALRIAWTALDPHTDSHDRDVWEIHAATKVYGKDVVNEFSSVRKMACPGPSMPENSPIKISSEYWYIKVVPHPEIFRKEKGTSSPEMVRLIPEPHIAEAAFLIDLYGGDVIARRLVCP